MVRLDFVAMDLRRRSWLETGPCSLTLAYDASPQHGVEIFNTFARRVEALDPSVVRQCATFDPAAPFTDPALWQSLQVTQSILPCQVLGCGRMSVADKVAALLNQIFLEFGPDAATMRRALLSVVCALSDMAAELAIADCRDCLDVFLRTGGVAETFVGESLGAGRSEPSVGYLFPLAMQVPGPIHIVDLVLRTALGATAWWAA